MGQVRKIADEYYIEFHARGLLYQQKAGKDHTHAQKMLQQVEQKIAQGELLTIVRDVDIDIFFNSFLEHAQKERTVKTFGRFEQTVKHFNAFLNKKFPQSKKLSEITPKVIEHYRAYLIKRAKESTPPVKPRIINFTLLLLRDILEYGIKLGYINDNPTLHARFVAEPKRREPKGLDERSTEGILNSLSSEDKISEMRQARGVLRSTFAKALLKRGVPLLKLNQILGLDDIAKVMRWWGWGKNIPRP